MKYYQAENEEHAFPLSEFQDWILGYEKEIILFEMKRDIGGPMFCRKMDCFVEKGDCGFTCFWYDPCNGKSGRCRCLKHGFIETGKKFKLTAKGLSNED